MQAMEWGLDNLKGPLHPEDYMSSCEVQGCQGMESRNSFVLRRLTTHSTAKCLRAWG